VKRRAFLQLLAAAPIAALVPWRVVDVPVFSGPLPLSAYEAEAIAFLEAMNAELQRTMFFAVNPPLVCPPLGRLEWLGEFGGAGEVHFAQLENPPVVLR
jgi:hypothetical protein